MKEIIALLWAVCIAVVTIYLLVKNKINNTSSGLLFSMAIIGGLAIANYDFIKRFEGFGVKVETARQEIATAKTEALSEIERDVEAHKQSIAMLIRTGNDLNGRLENQKTIVNSMIEKAQSLEQQLQEDQRNIEHVKQQVVLAHQNSQSILDATKELSIILTRITYVQAQTKSEFGNTPRLQKAAEIIQDDINRVLVLMIPDAAERRVFVQNLINALPSR